MRGRARSPRPGTADGSFRRKSAPAHAAPAANSYDSGACSPGEGFRRLDTTAFVRWLQGTIVESGNAVPRRIIRFNRQQDFRRFVEAWREANSGKHGAARPVLKGMGLIHAVSCPLPPIDPPSRFGGSLRLEDDARVRVHGALTRPAQERGIPWGVRQVKAPLVWGTTTGLNVRVGVIDTGADYRHPDLARSLGRGINLINRALLPYDDNGHGTHIAATIAAAGGMRGMTGMAPRAVVHPVKAFDHNGSAYVSDIVLGIDWCIRNRVHIINMSFGMKTKSKALLNAVTTATGAGITVIASSGNDGKRKSVDYPARYGQTIAVGATTKLRRPASFSNRGAHIDIFAPGEGIVSAWLRGGYREMNGTSMATSHVAGAVALLLAHRPGLQPAEIKALLRQTAQPLKNAKAPRLSAGELDVARLLKAADAGQ